MAPGTGTDEASAPSVRTRIVLLAGPSGSGKSSLAARAGVPTVCLDDFYKDGDDPTLPVDAELGIVDWDDPVSWDVDEALRALTALARDGRADVPVYDIPTSRRVGARSISSEDAPLVVAEGIFAAELVGRCDAAGILADAMCLAHRPVVTFWRRLLRDLREGRKAPLTLVRRGWALRRAEPAIVARQVALGCDPVSGDDATRRLTRLAAEGRAAAVGSGDLAA